jgi:hypothetical protein
MPGRLEQTHVARLWEHPRLCVGIFGVQFFTDEGARIYEEAGINEQMFTALGAAADHGLLLARPMQDEHGTLVMVYWESYEALDRWARSQPNSLWWKWLVDHEGQGIGFYHEIYTASGAEAIYTAGMQTVGPGRFAALDPVAAGKGESRTRQRRFADAAD